MKKLTDILSGPERWVQHVYAADADGDRVGSSSKNATCWCLTGAERKVTRDRSAEIILVVHKAIRQSICELFPAFANHEIEAFNDRLSTTFEMVHAVAARADELIFEQMGGAA